MVNATFQIGGNTLTTTGCHRLVLAGKARGMSVIDLGVSVEFVYFCYAIFKVFDKKAHRTMAYFKYDITLEFPNM